MARRARVALIAFGLTLMGAGLLVLLPDRLALWREPAMDFHVRLAPEPAASVLVVDIGAVDEAGRPWDRRASARLAARLAAAGPAVVGWDMVFSGSCAPDGPNAALAAGLARAPTVLGFLLSSSGQRLEAPAPMLGLAGDPPDLWPAPGAEGPCPIFAPAGVGSVALIGDDGARVRKVPAAVQVGGQIRPSLPVEMLWVGRHRLPVLAPGPILLMGETVFALDGRGELRFRPSSPARADARTVAAADVLAGRVPETRIAGALVLVGSSLPQRGGVRATATGPLTPSVQIWADALEGLAAGQLPERPRLAPWAEAGALVLGGVGLAGLILIWPPALAFAGAVGLAALWPLGGWLVARAQGVLVDPVGPPALLVLAALVALILGAAAASRAERALRGRMRQLLPDAVVARIAERPDLLRLRGEAREITALFTDLEGFTALTNRLPPEALIALLDRYFTAVSAVVLRHGGMIDKIVGDAVHALFNAPLDLPGHAQAALDCAAEIVAVTEALRADLPDLGRTRIGVETGPAVLGDVGSAARIDYTAHGPAVNMAARLQEAAKTLGPTVIIGPGTAAATTGTHPLGRHEIRGFGTVDLFTL